MNKKAILAIIPVLLMSTSVLACSNNGQGSFPSWFWHNGFCELQKVNFHLSGAVMPVPPYGSSDIPGSDKYSNLIITQVDGKVIIHGDMDKLNPNTVYTVYISNGYTPFKWDISGTWDLNFVATSGAIGTYEHMMIVTQADGTLTGTGYYVPDSSYTWVIDPGSYVSGNSVHILLHYTGGHPTTWTSVFDATIQSDGTLVGTWSDNQGNSGTLSTNSGKAAGTGDTGWTGQFDSTVPFTFKTNKHGDAGWTTTLKASDADGKTLSIWINGPNGATMLISDNFKVAVCNNKNKDKFR